MTDADKAAALDALVALLANYDKIVLFHPMRRAGDRFEPDLGRVVVGRPYDTSCVTEAEAPTVAEALAAFRALR